MFVCKNKTKPVPPTISSSTTKINFLKKSNIDTVDSSEVAKNDTFHLAKSSLHFYTIESNEMETMKNDDALTKTLKKEFMFFQGCAAEYKLKTDSQMDFLSLLDYNSNIAKKHGRGNVSMLWNLVKMAYKTVPLKRTHVSHLISQNSNQSSSALSGITRASGSFGNAGIGNLSANGVSNLNNIHPDGSGDHPAQSIFGGSTNDLDTESTGITIPKVSISDLEVEVFDENVNHNSINSLHLRNGFLYTGPHDNVIKDLPACSSSAINHDLTHAHYRSEIVREIETSPVSFLLTFKRFVQVTYLLLTAA